MSSATPAAEVAIDDALVRQLLSEQAPHLADGELSRLGSGWDNSIFRLGDDLLVRLPRRAAAVDLVRHEHRWLPQLAERLPLPIPVPVVCGQPSSAFAWPWSVVPYFSGDDALTGVIDPATVVDQLVELIGALHHPAPDDAPSNAVRGVPLQHRDGAIRRRLLDIDHWLTDRPEPIDPARLRHTWDDALVAPLHAAPPCWLHGDLHPGNVIVEAGRIVAVVDFGDLTSGDPATDLAAAWMFFDAPERERFRASLAIDAATWRRARGWALSVGVAIAAHSADRPIYDAFAARTLARVVDGR